MIEEHEFPTQRAFPRPVPALEYAVMAIVDRLAAAPPGAPYDRLRQGARQCQTALAACRRSRFDPELIGLLAAKIARLERDFAASAEEDPASVAFFRGR